MRECDTAFKTEYIVRHVDSFDPTSYMLLDDEMRSSMTSDVAKMIFALKQHVTMHKCRDWNFKLMNKDIADNYW